MRRALLTAGLLLLAFPALAQRTELWGHAGSIVVAEWRGSSVLIRYLIPDEDLLAAGVRPGLLLFAGRVEWASGRLRGTARPRSRACPGGVRRAVSGRMTRGPEGLHRIRLRGPVPRSVPGCRAASFADTAASDLLFLEWTE